MGIASIHTYLVGDYQPKDNGKSVPVPPYGIYRQTQGAGTASSYT